MGPMYALPVGRWWREVIALGLLAVGLILSGAGLASAATCRRVQTPNVGTGYNRLSAVSVTSSRNAWAVGDDGRDRGLIEHWNGKAWKIQPSPSPRGINSDGSRLTGVTATSSRNAWAVGVYYRGTPPHAQSRTVIERWNGKAWKLQASPNPGFEDDRLLGVAATSSTNAWAVGFYFANASHSLIEHWDGKAWKLQPSPKIDELDGVAATSSRNAWAVGSTDLGQPVIEHWNGKAWKIQASPNNINELVGVAATSSSNAWAVGGIIPENPENEPKTLIEHWNGKAWKIQASPKLQGAILSAVAATSPTNALAVGSTGLDQPVIEQWNGKAWKLQASPNNINELFGVAASSSTNAWVVGESVPSAMTSSTTVALHCG